MRLPVSSSKPYCSDSVVEVDGTSVLAEKETSAAVDEMIPPDQEALGKILVLMKVLRLAVESSRLVGSLVRSVVRVAPEWTTGTNGAITVSFVVG